MVSTEACMWTIDKSGTARWFGHAHAFGLAVVERYPSACRNVTITHRAGVYAVCSGGGGDERYLAVSKCSFGCLTHDENRFTCDAPFMHSLSK